MDTLQIAKAMLKKDETKRNFRGVFACDKLPKSKFKKKNPACFIINTDPASKPGTHWVALYFPCNGRAEYFDSFGIKPKIGSILNFISKNSPNGYVYNKTQLQNVLSTICGNYCCEYLLHRCQRKPRNLFFKKYNTKKTITNDQITLKNFKIHFIKSC